MVIASKKAMLRVPIIIKCANTSINNLNAVKDINYIYYYNIKLCFLKYLVEFQPVEFKTLLEMGQFYLKYKYCALYFVKYDVASFSKF